jgi:hypothetical protein
MHLFDAEIPHFKKKKSTYRLSATINALEKY